MQQRRHCCRTADQEQRRRRCWWEEVEGGSVLLAMDHHSSALKHPRDFEAPTTLDPQIPNGHKGRYFTIAPFDALLPILPGLVVDVFIVVRSYRGGLLLRALCSLFLSIFRHHSVFTAPAPKPTYRGRALHRTTLRFLPLPCLLVYYPYSLTIVPTQNVPPPGMNTIFTFSTVEPKLYNCNM